MKLTIDTVRISNFRQLENFTINLKPMTILVGPNGSGKSSFLRAMKFLSYNLQLYARELVSYKTFMKDDEFWGIPQIIYKFEGINFLSFNDVVSNNDETRTIEFIIEGKFYWPQSDEEELERDYKSVEEFIRILRKDNINYWLQELLIAGDEKFFEFTLNFSFDKDGYVNFSFLDKKNNCEVVYYNRDFSQQGIFINKKKMTSYANFRFPDKDYIKKLIEETPNKNRYKNVANYKRFLYRTFKISELYNRIILGYIFSLEYLPPIRKIPKGIYILNNGFFPKDEDYDFWNDFLSKDEFMNLDSLIDIKFELEEKYVEGIEFSEKDKKNNERSSKLSIELVDWKTLFDTLEELGLAKGIFKEIDEKNNIGQIKVVTLNDAIINIENESSGFLQLFPILIYTSDVLNNDFKIYDKKILIVEQPELHLHPNVQYRLPKYLRYENHFRYCQVNFFENNYSIIETHSEHLIRGVQVEVAKGNLKPEDVAVYYVDKDENGISSVRLLELDENGNFTTEWPSGFMDLSSKAAYELLNVQLKNKSK